MVLLEKAISGRHRLIAITMWSCESLIAVPPPMRDALRSNCDRALAYCLSILFSENWYSLFRKLLWLLADSRVLPLHIIFTMSAPTRLPAAGSASAGG